MSTPQEFGFGWFARTALASRSTMVDIVVATLLVNLFSTAMPLFTQILIDRVLVHHNGSALHVFAIALLGVMIFEFLVSSLRSSLQGLLAARTDARAGPQILERVLRMKARYFEQAPVGDTLSRLHEVESVRNFVTGSAVTSFLDLAFAGIFFLLMLWTSPALTVVVVVSLVVVLAISLLSTPVIRKGVATRTERGAQAHARLVEMVSGVQTLKALAVELPFLRRWEESYTRYLNVNVSLARVGGLFRALTQLVQRLSLLLVFWVGAQDVMAGALSLGQLIAFQMLANLVFGPVLRVSGLWQDLQRTAVSMKRLQELLNNPVEDTVGRSERPATVRGDIALRNVTLVYPGRPNAALDNVSLDLHPGELVAVMGASGSGKSSLAKLLLCMADPTAGELQLDGRPLSRLDVQWLRRQIGYVPQDVVLFSDTVRNNICLRHPQASPDELEAAIRAAGAHEFISALPGGYDAELTERGQGLSGGQRQRIAIARALLGAPRILLLDEPTSALDGASERQLLDTLCRLKQRCTIVLITHRLPVLDLADRIVVLENGRIAQDGAAPRLQTGARLRPVAEEVRSHA